MTDATAVAPLGPGTLAPAFSLPAINRETMVSLEHYRGSSALLLAFFRGVH